MFQIHHNYSHLLKAFFTLFFFLLLKPFNSLSQNASSQRSLFVDFVSNNKKIDTLSSNDAVSFLNYIKVMNCLSGTIYFSGNGFSHVMSVHCRNNITLLKCLERCVPGSKLTLEKCAFERDGEMKPIVVNKIVVFQ